MRGMGARMLFRVIDSVMAIRQGKEAASDAEWRALLGTLRQEDFKGL
jgi:hypothetical protein